MRKLQVLVALCAAALPFPALADDDRRTHAPGIGVEQALRIARGYGMTVVTEVEREDGGWEIEGRDHRGRSLEVKINAKGRVTSVEREGR